LLVKQQIAKQQVLGAKPYQGALEETLAIFLSPFLVSVDYSSKHQSSGQMIALAKE
jgi:hypothetical protein